MMPKTKTKTKAVGLALGAGLALAASGCATAPAGSMGLHALAQHDGRVSAAQSHFGAGDHAVAADLYLAAARDASAGVHVASRCRLWVDAARASFTASDAERIEASADGLARCLREHPEVVLPGEDRVVANLTFARAGRPERLALPHGAEPLGDLVPLPTAAAAR